MGLGKAWEDFEDEILIENYSNMTTKELLKLLPHRSKKGIERRIEILRENGKIGYRSDSTIKRAYKERHRRGEW